MNALRKLSAPSTRKSADDGQDSTKRHRQQETDSEFMSDSLNVACHALQNSTIPYAS